MSNHLENGSSFWKNIQHSMPTNVNRTLSQSRRRNESVHIEKHSGHGEVLRDIIIGFSDGMTVPFALTAGLSSLGNSKVVILGGLAELFSGAISMGLGAYLAAITDAQHYAAEEARERREVVECPDAEESECYEILEGYNLSRAAIRPIIEELREDHDSWVKFMMDFELKLEKPPTSRAWVSALTMGLAYFLGGIIPMIPYFAMKNVTHALFVSIGITVVMLVVFGYIKTYRVIASKKAAVWGAMQTLFVGAVAAGASYGIVRAMNSDKAL